MAAPAAAAAALAKKRVIWMLVRLAIGGLFMVIIFSAALGAAMLDAANATCALPQLTGQSPSILPVSAQPGDPDPAELARFMWAKRVAESGGDNGNYTAQSPWSSASGAYQYIDTTWQAPAHKAIWSKYGNFPRAKDAPPAVQDEVARFDFVSAWHTYGNWAQVAMTHYMPAWVSDPSKWDTVPFPDAGNTMTLRQYAAHVLKIMGRAPDFPPGTEQASLGCRKDFKVSYTPDGSAGSLAVAAAVRYIGIGYKYGGGRTVGSQWLGMDCSGFTLAAYRDIGITIGGYTGTQKHDGIPVPSLASAMPGDLILLGYPPDNDKHVVMYYGFINGKHMVLESSGAGEECKANNPTYGSNPRCKGIGPPHEFSPWNYKILGIRRIVCGIDSAGHATPCSGGV